MKREEIQLLSDFPTRPGRGAIVCPVLARWPMPLADTLAHLPIASANAAVQAMLASLPVARARHGAHVALFAGDPFLHLPSLFRAAERAGIKRLAAYPTAQFYDGDTARAVAAVGYGLDADRAFVRSARRYGFQTLSFALDAPGALALESDGADRIVLHPGPAGPDMRANDAAAAALARAAKTLAAQKLAAKILVYCAPGYGRSLDAACALAHGQVVPRGQSAIA